MTSTSATPNRNSRASAATTAGAILSAVLASACCVGPLVLAVLGIGGGALLVRLEPLRPLFIVVTASLLGTGFYFAYRMPKPSATNEGGSAAATLDAACDCPAPQTRTAGKLMLWIAAVVVVLFVAAPYLIPLFVRS